MTSSAIFEREVAAERSLAVVRTETRLATCRDEMLRRRGRAHLTRLWGAGREPVTVSTREPLSRIMIGMTKGASVSTRVSACWSIGLLLVADSARCNLAARSRFAGRSVARVATIVCPEICRD